MSDHYALESAVSLGILNFLIPDYRVFELWGVLPRELGELPAEYAIPLAVCKRMGVLRCSVVYLALYLVPLAIVLRVTPSAHLWL